MLVLMDKEAFHSLTTTRSSELQDTGGMQMVPYQQSIYPPGLNKKQWSDLLNLFLEHGLDRQRARSASTSTSISTSDISSGLSASVVREQSAPTPVGIATEREQHHQSLPQEGKYYALKLRTRLTDSPY